jgi:hypothetical protein
MSTNLMSWRNRLASLLGGTMFGGMRDLYSTFGYTRNPTFNQYLFKYLKQDIAKRIIDAPVAALWSVPPTIDADPAFTDAWQKLVAAKAVWSQLAVLDKLCGVGRYAVMVVGINDGQPLDQPVRSSPPGVTGKLREVLYLQPYMEGSVQILKYEEDSSNPRFGQPTLYQINPAPPDLETYLGAGGGSGSGGTVISAVAGQRQAFLVHHSRVLHVADNTLENSVFGLSRLAPVYNRLDDLEKVVGGAAETFWMTGNRGLQADVDKEMELSPEDAKNLEEEIDGYVNDLRRVIKTRGVTIKNIGSEVADPKNIVDVLISLISANTGLPKRVLMGSEAGQLASAQDRANWAERVAERQQQFGAPVMLVPFINLMTNLGVLPASDQLTITWAEAFKMSPLERAQTSAALGRTAANLQKMISDPIGSIEVIEETVETGGGSSVGVDGETVEVPPTSTKKVTRKWIEGGTPLLSTDEARSVVGMGKGMPVFDGSDTEDFAIKQ